jgi:hypothetical protein
VNTEAAYLRYSQLLALQNAARIDAAKVVDLDARRDRRDARRERTRQRRRVRQQSREASR